MANEHIDIQTSQGVCKTEIITPEGSGPWPAIILCFDAGGQRPAMTEIGEHLSKKGYLVAIPDFYHRGGDPMKLLPPGTERVAGAMFKHFFGNDELKAKFFGEFYGPATNYDNLEVDGGAVLDALEKRSDVKKGLIGTTGYCMGGNISFRLATIFGDRIKATAGFHAGYVVSPAPDSPHTRAGAIKSTVYLAGAIEDESFTDEAKKTLETALTEAHVKHTVETYPGKHGFAVSDNPSFDKGCQDRHYAALEKLFGETLA